MIDIKELNEAWKQILDAEDRVNGTWTPPVRRILLDNENGYNLREQVDFLEQAFDELERLQEKATPMKPNLISHDNRMTSFVDFQCSKCNIIVSQKIRLISVCIKDDVVKMEHCPHCGQKLDWT